MSNPLTESAEAYARDKNGPNYCKLQLAALDFVEKLFDIKYLDGGERHKKLEYARMVLKEFQASFASTARMLENNEAAK